MTESSLPNVGGISLSTPLLFFARLVSRPHGIGHFWFTLTVEFKRSVRVEYKVQARSLEQKLVMPPLDLP